MSTLISKLRSSLAILLLITPVAQAAVTRLPPPVPPLVRLVAPVARQPIQLQKVEVRTEVVGSFAHTRVEMVFYNPNALLLEGELQFPLLAGQSVTGFALDINGELRAAVPVDKARGQQVFEDVSRARIDPALLEQTHGNNYKLRVYPLPAHGMRRVVLEIEGALEVSILKGKRHAIFRLPLQFADKVGELDITVNNPAIRGGRAMPVRARLGAETLDVNAPRIDGKGQRNGSTLGLSRKNYTGRNVLNVDYPDLGEALAITERRADQTYFYTEVAVPDDQVLVSPHPLKVGLVWDASGSGALRDHGREFALLDAYFGKLGNVEVELVIARDRAEPVRSFTIEHGDWQPLRAVLESVAYDGATAAAALTPPESTQLNLLFSDGLFNYGPAGLQAGAVPLFTVNAAVSADLLRLGVLAEPTGGRLLDMLHLLPADAVTALTCQSTRLTGLSSNGAKELIVNSPYPEKGRMQLAGVLTEPEATITLNWLDGRGIARSQRMVIRNADAARSGQAASRWAAMKLASLETDYAQNRAAIRRLGADFGRVTRETSLIVLDRVEDYVRYEIVPPASLRADYERLLSEKGRNRKAERDAHLDDIAARFAQKVEWWGKSFPKGDKPRPKEDNRYPLFSFGLAGSARPEAVAVAAPAPAPMAMAAPRVAERMAAAGSLPTPQTPAEASIQLKRWESDAPYARRLNAAEPAEMYRIYLDERQSYLNSTAFFLDAADIFFARGQSELGLRILSNLAEMDLENRQVLRILAYRLLQAKQVGLALPVLQKVLALSPDEPQSWRDLGLAYAEDGQYQQAADNLWEVVAHPWHGRFPDIELVALAELNAV
ncbi:MAG: tetratricopeptide repeat protein, partial [Gallionella sp.]|nr:tetratricopeptide repeat protein [Gallionella sp.]